MKYLIVGLGNPGEKYSNTRHNIGFNVVEKLAIDQQCEFKSKQLAFYTKFVCLENIAVMIKPSTFMNLSGNAVRHWMGKEGVRPESILIVTDDVALPFGTLKMKEAGGHGGHNGLTDIINHLGSKDFPRLRFGIGDHYEYGEQANYVLGKWSNKEREILPERIEKAGEMVLSFISHGIDKTMNDYNNT